jgi:hypothetical protein
MRVETSLRLDAMPMRPEKKLKAGRPYEGENASA